VGYSTASVTALPPVLGGTRPCPNGFHWHTTGDAPLTFWNYPTVVPLADRSEATKDAPGKDYIMTYALRLRQSSPGRVSLEGLMWLAIDGEIMPLVHRAYWGAFDGRMRAHVAAVDYTPGRDVRAAAQTACASA
jgi:hypothetical protein